jgi:hypothetical protein
MKTPKDPQDEPINLYDPQESQEEIAEDYSDIEIDVIPSSHEEKLGWSEYD